MKRKSTPKAQRPSISIAGSTYTFLRTRVPKGHVAPFVAEIVVEALNDPEISGRLVEKCLQEMDP